MDADRIVAKLQAQQAMEPRGIRNNNPGNLRPGPVPWQGQTGSEDGYCVFDTPEHGLRALAKQLVIYQTKHGLCTIRAIVSRWAPSNENDTNSYVSAVCADTGFGPDDWLHLTESTVLYALVVAIVRHENGCQPYSDAQIAQAVTEAIG